MSDATSQQRLFLHVDPHTRALRATCTGPSADGRCPGSAHGEVPCGGTRVVPAQGTSANGIPFTIVGREWARCPLGWLTRDLIGES